MAPRLHPALAALLFALGTSTEARAERLEVRWDAPAECPSQADVARRLDEALRESGAGAALVRGEVRPHAAGYHASVHVRGPHGEGTREFDAPTCEAAAEMAVVVVAMSATPPEASTPRAPAQPTDEALPPTPAEPRESPRASLPRAARFAVEPRAGLDVGTLPAAAPTVGGALDWMFAGRARVALGAAYETAQMAHFGGTNFGARFWAYAVDLRACVDVVRGAFELGPCVGAGITGVGASGFGGIVAKDGQATWWAPSLAGVARWRMTPNLALGVLAEAVVPTSRRSFVFTDLGALHRAAPVGFRAFVAPELRF